MKTGRIACLLGAAVLCMAVVVCVSTFTACDVVSGMDGLTVSPSYTVLSSGSNTVELSVSGGTSNSLALPLTWSMTRPDLGYIAQDRGYTAIYYRLAPDGDNIVIATDQYGNEGYARIRQADGGYALSLSASPMGDTNTWTVSVSSPVGGWYEWWVRDPTVGTISSLSSGPSAVYTVKLNTESNDIFVRDDSGNIGAVSIP